MKRYIRSKTDIDASQFKGYCHYTATNPTWGGDAHRILTNLGGEKGYVKFSNPYTGGYYRPSIIYLFPDISVYEEFVKHIKEHELDHFIRTYGYKDLPEDVVILELGY